MKHPKENVRAWRRQVRRKTMTSPVLKKGGPHPKVDTYPSVCYHCKGSGCNYCNEGEIYGEE